MNYVLITVEEATKGLSGLELLSAADKILLFYQRKHSQISLELHTALMATDAQTEFIELTRGNTLLYECAFTLGVLSASPNVECVYLIGDIPMYGALANLHFSEMHAEIKTAHSLTEILDPQAFTGEDSARISDIPSESAVFDKLYDKLAALLGSCTTPVINPAEFEYPCVQGILSASENSSSLYDGILLYTSKSRAKLLSLALEPKAKELKELVMKISKVSELP